VKKREGKVEKSSWKVQAIDCLAKLNRHQQQW